MDRKGTVMELDEILNAEPEFRYRMLSRMKSDCEYYLGYGGRSANHLWALDEAKQIEYMKASCGIGGSRCQKRTRKSSNF